MLLVEGNDFSKRNSIDGISMLDDVSTVKLFFCSENVLEGQCGIGDIFGNSKLHLMRIPSLSS